MKFAAWYVTRWEPLPPNPFMKKKKLSKLEDMLFESPREDVQVDPTNKDDSAIGAPLGQPSGRSGLGATVTPQR